MIPSVIWFNARWFEEAFAVPHSKQRKLMFDGVDGIQEGKPADHGRRNLCVDAPRHLLHVQFARFFNPRAWRKRPAAERWPERAVCCETPPCWPATNACGAWPQCCADAEVTRCRATRRTLVPSRRRAAHITLEVSICTQRLVRMQSRSGAPHYSGNCSPDRGPRRASRRSHHRAWHSPTTDSDLRFGRARIDELAELGAVAQDLEVGILQGGLALGGVVEHARLGGRLQPS
jgi:hypothetical protein